MAYPSAVLGFGSLQLPSTTSGYVYVTSILNGCVLEIPGGGYDNMAAILNAPKNAFSPDSQLWLREYQPDGSFYLIAKMSGKVLTGNGGAGSNVTVWDRYEGGSQHWRSEGNQLVSTATNLVVDISGGSSAPYSPLIMWDRMYPATLSQEFRMEEYVDPYWSGMAVPQSEYTDGLSLQGSYPPQQPSYLPQQPSYPPQEPFYPSQQPSYPPQQPSYPPQQPSYPPQQPSYPPQQPSYPPQQLSYPPQQPSYHPQQPSYPPQQPSYPPQQPSYPPQQPSYPPQQPSYPSQQQSIPPQQPSIPPQQPSCPPQQPSCPPQQPSYPPQQPSYPSQQPSFPPQQPSHPCLPNAPVVQVTQPLSFIGGQGGNEIKEGTVKPFARFDPEADAKILHTAMKGLFKDEGSVVHVLAYRSNQQRQQLKLKFKVLFGKDLSYELHSDFGGNFGRAVYGLVMSPTEFDAYCLRQGIEGLGTDNHVLIEILCTRTNQEILAIKQEYKTKFNRDLEQDVTGDTSGDFKRLLVSMLSGFRDEANQVDEAKARADAERLYQAGEARWGTDESVFNQILASRSFPQLRATFQAYAKLSKYDMEQVIEKEMSGHLKEGMVAIVKCVKDKSSYFAEKLYKSMKGLGTDDNTLVRVIVSRSEVDMVNIKNVFRRQYGKTLGSFIKGDTSGHYQKLLLALVHED